MARFFVDVYDNTFVKVKTFIINYIFFLFSFAFTIACYTISIELNKDIIDAKIIGYLMIISGISIFFPFYSNSTIFFKKNHLIINDVDINYLEIDNVYSVNFKNDFINTFHSEKIIFIYGKQNSIEVIINRRLWKDASRRIGELKTILDSRNIKNTL